MNVDFIIIGQGIAGTSFAFELLKNNKTFVIVDKYDSNSPSRIALGVYNPLVLKWFTKAWNIDIQIDYFYEFYNQINKFLELKTYHDISIYKFLKTVYTQNNWLTKSASSNRIKYMSSKLYSLKNKYLLNNKFYGIVKYSGRVDLTLLLESFRTYCINHNMLINDRIDYTDLIINKNSFQFQNIKSKKIVFCEGYSVMKNPFFSKLNLNPIKGELLTIFCRDLNLDKIIHLGGLLVPLGNDYYKVGSTYNSIHISNKFCTENGRLALIGILDRILKCPYKIVNHAGAFRPSTLDRRALLGSHLNYKNMYILNGLGTRGVLLAPYLSKLLFNNIYSSCAIPDEVNINRL